jgi:hypothetical protein
MPRRKIDEEPRSVQGNFVLVTDEKEMSTPWFRDGLTKALEGYATATLVDRDELYKMHADGQRVTAVVIDATYLTGWEDYIRQVKLVTEKVHVAFGSPDWEEARKAFNAGASRCFFKSFDPDTLKQELIGL